MRPYIEKPKTQNRRLEPTGLANPSKTRGLTGMGPGLARQDVAGQVVGRFWNRTELFFRSEPGPVANTTCRSYLFDHRSIVAISAIVAMTAM